MKNRIQKFVHSQFGEIRTIVDEAGKPWFVGKDVTSRLGYKNGRNRLFSWLRANGYLFKTSTEPVQKWVKKGYFTINASLFEDGRGRLHETITTKVTGKGQRYFLNLFINNQKS